MDQSDSNKSKHFYIDGVVGYNGVAYKVKGHLKAVSEKQAIFFASHEIRERLGENELPYSALKNNNHVTWEVAPYCVHRPHHPPNDLGTLSIEEIQDNLDF